MARLGEGDSRWIVQDLGESGRNVSGWHWEEKNCTHWAHNWIKSALVGLALLPDVEGSSIQITEVSKLEGEVVYCNRKGKNLFFFDINARIVWKGSFNGAQVSGDIILPEFSQDIILEELEYTVNATDSNSEAAKQALRKPAIVPIREKLREFVAALAAEYSETRTTPSPVRKDGSLPSLESSSSSSSSSSSTTTPTVATPSSVTVVKEAASGVSTQSFKSIVEFAAAPSDIFACLTDRGRVSIYTQSAAEISAEAGASFSLFSNSITGSNIKMVRDQSIVQKWRFQEWPANHFSKVTITLEPISSGTRLTLDHRDIPSDDFERTRAGWRTHFWERIRIVFGYNFKPVK